jgi:hypothetical protein
MPQSTDRQTTASDSIIRLAGILQKRRDVIGASIEK